MNIKCKQYCYSHIASVHIKHIGLHCRLHLLFHSLGLIWRSEAKIPDKKLFLPCRSSTGLKGTSTMTERLSVTKSWVATQWNKSSDVTRNWMILNECFFFPRSAGRRSLDFNKSAAPPPPPRPSHPLLPQLKWSNLAPEAHGELHGSLGTRGPEAYRASGSVWAHTDPNICQIGCQNRCQAGCQRECQNRCQMPESMWE